MIAAESSVRDFEKSQPIPSFRLNAPNNNPFVPSLPTSVTGEGLKLQFSWKSEGANADAVSELDQTRELWELAERLRRETVRFPESVAARINLAKALSNQGRLNDAEEELSRALEIDDDNYLVRLNLAHLLVLQGRLDEAASSYNKLLLSRPLDKTVLLSLAVLALRRRDFSEAEEKLKQAAANKDEDGTVHFLLGMVRLCMNNLRGAITELRAAARIDVRNPAIHQALGVVFALRAELPRAEQEFRAALKFVPNDRASIRALYQVLLNQGKSAEAVDVLKSFIDRNPGDGAAREALALGLVDLKKFSNARFHLSRLLGGESGILPVEQAARIQANIGLCWLSEGKLGDARKALLRAIDMYPRVSPIAYENLARLYLAEENEEAALGILIRSRAIFPESANTTVLVSHVYSLVGDYGQGIREIEEFRRHHDATVEMYGQLSFLYIQADNTEESLNVSKEGAKRFPHAAPILNNLAYVYAMTDQLEEARATLRMVPKDISPHTELIATRGLLKLREGDERAGTQLYEEAERVASELGNKDLVRRVRQKKHLELARYWMQRKAPDKARLELKRGFNIKVKHFSQKDDLKRLASDLENLLVN